MSMELMYFQVYKYTFLPIAFSNYHCPNLPILYFVNPLKIQYPTIDLNEALPSMSENRSINRLQHK